MKKTLITSTIFAALFTSTMAIAQTQTQSPSAAPARSTLEEVPSVQNDTPHLDSSASTPSNHNNNNSQINTTTSTVDTAREDSIMRDNANDMVEREDAVVENERNDLSKSEKEFLEKDANFVQIAQ